MSQTTQIQDGRDQDDDEPCDCGDPDDCPRHTHKQPYPMDRFDIEYEKARQRGWED